MVPRNRAGGKQTPSDKEDNRQKKERNEISQGHACMHTVGLRYMRQTTLQVGRGLEIAHHTITGDPSK